jgi:outer membrane protein assembly factor BamB
MSHFSRAAICVLVVVLSVNVSSANAQDWPQWRGPNRDGKTAGFKTPAAWPAKLVKKWDLTIGSGVSNPSLVGDRLYTLSREGENEVVRCLNAATSEEIWKDSYASAAPQGSGAGGGRFIGPRATPTIVRGRVLTLSANGLLSCYDATTGEVKWRKEEFVGKVPGFYTSSSPIVVDGLCIAQLGAGGGGSNRENASIQLGATIAYDLITGDEKWRAQDASPAYASPVLMNVDGLKIVVCLSEQRLVALNVANGKTLWQVPLRQSRYNSSSPVIDGNVLIFAGPGTQGLTAVKFTRQGEELKDEPAWNNQDNQMIFNTPVLRDGALFAYNTQDQIFTLKADHTTGWATPIIRPPAETGRFVPPGGQVVFAQPQPQEGERRGGDGGGQPRGQQRGRGRNLAGGERPGYGSIVDVGPALVALCPIGELVVFAPNANEYKEIARYRVSNEGDVYSHPILSGNRIYIKDRDSVALWMVE